MHGEPPVSLNCYTCPAFPKPSWDRARSSDLQNSLPQSPLPRAISIFRNLCDPPHVAISVTCAANRLRKRLIPGHARITRIHDCTGGSSHLCAPEQSSGRGYYIVSVPDKLGRPQQGRLRRRWAVHRSPARGKGPRCASVVIRRGIWLP